MFSEENVNAFNRTVENLKDRNNLVSSTESCNTEEEKNVKLLSTVVSPEPDEHSICSNNASVNSFDTRAELSPPKLTAFNESDSEINFSSSLYELPLLQVGGRIPFGDETQTIQECSGNAEMHDTELIERDEIESVHSEEDHSQSEPDSKLNCEPVFEEQHLAVLGSVTVQRRSSRVARKMNGAMLSLEDPFTADVDAEEETELTQDVLPEVKSEDVETG